MASTTDAGVLLQELPVLRIRLARVGGERIGACGLRLIGRPEALGTLRARSARAWTAH